MPEFFPLFAQAGVIAFQAGWLTVAAFDNIRHANLGERDFAQVLRMNLVATGDPEAYKDVSYRRIENPGTEELLFRLLVAAEAIVAALLWLSVLALLLAALGILGDAFARSLAMIAVLGFVAIWGVATLVFLAVAP